MHTITHVEIPAPDMDKAVEFSSKGFGWKIELMPGGGYAIFTFGNAKSGGGFDNSTKSAELNQGPGLVINAEDIG